jgi:SAM-dependent methyltransferase
MDAPSKEYLIHYYNRLLSAYGDSPEALRWTPRGQRLRYNMLLEITSDLNGKRILDYGCGKGDFYGFLSKQNIHVDYTGMDINPSLIDIARDKYPSCSFMVRDIDDDDIDDIFDFIFVCGVFNNRVEGAKDNMLNAMTKLFGHAREGLAITGISAHSTQRDIEINYVYPEEITGFAVKRLTPYVVLRQDCIPDDFTLFLYRRPNVPRSMADQNPKNL